MGSDVIVNCDKLNRVFVIGRRMVHALRDVTCVIRRGEFVVLRGPSGSGKSTLLNIMGGLDCPDGGSLLVDGMEIGVMSAFERAAFRRRNIGFVAQSFPLISHLSAAENTSLPLMFDGKSRGELVASADALLKEVGLAQRGEHLPFELSLGERQRVAVARALMRRPPLLIADEPTANLDTGSAREVIRLLHRARDEGATIIAATHDPLLASEADRAVCLHEGSATSCDGVRDERV